MRLAELMRLGEQVKIKQVDANHRLDVDVTFAAGDLFGQGAGQVVGAARTPG